MDVEITDNNRMLDSIKGIHLELTNICTLKCPRCSRTEFIERFPKKWKNHSINLDDLKNFLDINLTNLVVELGGTYGDPIYYPQIFEVCRWLKANNAKIILVTNGSYKNKKWWENIATILNDEDEIYWSIDGLPENFTKYRINGDWDSIKNGIDIITKTKIKTIWKYIVFKYNQDDIETAKNLAKDLGFSSFKIIKSDRWTGENDFLKPKDEFVNHKVENNLNWIKNKTSNLVDPECINSNVMHFITAEGFYAPCCYITDFRFYYKTIWGKNKNNFSISTNTLSQILNSKEVIEYYSNLKNNVCDNVCRFCCPKI
jgi:MoaA/NifB/PqqE/SkfB family radical SAM enzyme